MIDMIVWAFIGGIAGFVVSEAFGLGRVAWLFGGVFSLAIYASLGN